VAGDLVQTKEVRSGYGYMGSSDLRVIFGLGKWTQVERLEIRWPSGIVQVLENLGVDQTFTIKEEWP